MEINIVSVFDNQEAEYLNRIHNNPQGFVVNVDRKGQNPAYPMVHLATHSAISGPELESYLTERGAKNLFVEGSWAWRVSAYNILNSFKSLTNLYETRKDPTH